jgi:hypothetical protein
MKTNGGEAGFRSEGHNPEMAVPSVLDDAGMLGLDLRERRSSQLRAARMQNEC